MSGFIAVSNVENGLVLGFQENGVTPFQLNMDDQANAHIAITGASGTGKSTLLRHIIRQMAGRGVHTVVIDNHGDLAVSGINLIRITEGMEDCPSINPLSLSPYEISMYGVRDSVSRCIESICRSTGRLGSSQIDCLSSTVMSIFERKGLDPDSQETWGLAHTNFSEVMNDLEDQREEAVSEQRKVIEALMKRLRPLSQSKVFNGNTWINADMLIQSYVVIDISSLVTEKKALVAETIMKMCFDAAVSLGPIPGGGWQNKLRFMVVIDEAATLTDVGGDPDDPDHIINVISKQGRKFGISMVVASQRLKHFGADTIANVGCKIALAPVLDGRELALLQKVFGFTADIKKHLSEKHAGVVLTSAAPRPMPIYTKFSVNSFIPTASADVGQPDGPKYDDI